MENELKASQIKSVNVSQVTDHQPDLPWRQQPLCGVGPAGAVLPRRGQVRHEVRGEVMTVMSRYNIFIKTRLDEDWEVREVIVPPVAKHNVEKVRNIFVCNLCCYECRFAECLNPPDKTIYSANTLQW